MVEKSNHCVLVDVMWMEVTEYSKQTESE